MTTILSPICGGCRNLIGESLMDPRCRAFPAGIPNKILLSRADHRQPFPGDGGIRFDPKGEEDGDYAAYLFSDPTE